MKNELIEIHEFNKQGYKSLMAYDSWRVAQLNYIDELEPLNITHFQKHNLTDEVFVLLEGQCVLYLLKADDGNFDIQAIHMEKGKVYNIKKGVYHTHTLSKDGKVLIIENENTDDSNSPILKIGKEVQNKLLDLKSKYF